jgi:hypothetical protein
MKTYINLVIAFILGLLVALSFQPSQATTKTYDAVKLTEYSACLNQADGTYPPSVSSLTITHGTNNTIDRYVAWCAPYKPM